MFKPNFKYTNKIVKNLTLIAENKTIIMNSPLIPKWEVKLRREALIRSAHSSTAIEGNPLSFEEVSDLANGRDIMVRRKDKQEVLNYIEALEIIPDLVKKEFLTEKDFLKIHKIVTNETLESPEYEGSLRNCEVVVGNRITGEVVFRPPSFNEVPLLLNNFLNWCNSDKTLEIDPVLHGGITHYEIVRIHPFVDGNGRTARIMATLVLYKRGFDTKRFFALDDYYDSNRASYYKALESVDKKSIDLTAWLEYFTEGVAVSIKAITDRVIGLSKDIKYLKEKGQIALTERQMNIVEFILKNDKATSTDIAGMFGVSRQAALKEMNKLVNLGVVELKGKKKGAHYILV
ncbi:MAG: Fic family protein [Actinomycetota bacterium]